MLRWFHRRLLLMMILRLCLRLLLLWAHHDLVLGQVASMVLACFGALPALPSDCTDP